MAQDQPSNSSWQDNNITTLPAETIYHISHFLDPLDLFRLQGVSKRLRAIIRDPVLWRSLYTAARLPLPPGPFPWQSIHFLQHALLDSVHLAHTWTTKPLTLVSRSTHISPCKGGSERFQYHWIRGRWFISSKDKKQISCRDVETGLEYVLWKRKTFGEWSATSVMNQRGHFIYVAVHLKSASLDDPVKLLEFVVDDVTGYLSGPEKIDVPTCSLSREERFIPQIRVESGLAPYLWISLDTQKLKQSLVFDSRSRRFYKFPSSFRTQLDILLRYRGAWLPDHVRVYFTETHLLTHSCANLFRDNVGRFEVIQTFTLPDVDSDPTDSVRQAPAIVRELRLTHESLIRGSQPFMWQVPIRNPTNDPITHTTTLRFLRLPSLPNPTGAIRLVCTDYVLHAEPPLRSNRLTDAPGPSATAVAATDHPHLHDHTHGSGDARTENIRPNAVTRSEGPVLPIILLTHEVCSMPGPYPCILLDASASGYVRGLCMVYHPPTAEIGERGGGRGDMVAFGGMVRKFAVDATGERCVAVVGDPSPPWGDLDTTKGYKYKLDGMRGKIWYTLQHPRDVLAVVDDFK